MEYANRDAALVQKYRIAQRPLRFLQRIKRKQLPAAVVEGWIADQNRMTWLRRVKQFVQSHRVILEYDQQSIFPAALAKYISEERLVPY